MIQGLIKTTAQLPQFEGIHVEVRINDQIPSQDSRCPCLGQSNLLRLALQNLLSNALEVSSPGKTVAVSLYSDTDCHIEITNEGTIPLEIRDRFFDKFVTWGKQTGTGLGTYSAKMMIKAQGGDIAMRTSDEDNETVVTVRLPC